MSEFYKKNMYLESREELNKIRNKWAHKKLKERNIDYKDVISFKC